MNRFHLADWKAEYLPEDAGETISDGTQWQVTVSTKHGFSTSRGDNAYPSAGRVMRTSTESAVFDDLMKAFEALVNT